VDLYASDLTQTGRHTAVSLYLSSLGNILPLSALDSLGICQKPKKKKREEGKKKVREDVNI